MPREIDEIKDDLDRTEFELANATAALTEAENVSDETAIRQNKINVEAAQRELIRFREELRVAGLYAMLGEAREHLAYVEQLHTDTIALAREQVGNLEKHIREAGLDPDNP